MSNLKVRGAVVYRLASAIKFAAFGFLALTTAIFVWASFSNYFFEKFGPAVASVMGVVAIIVMYFLIDKGLDKLVEFLADEKINPGTPSSDENPKAKKAFIRIALFMALIRLLATGTTSIWGSYEIADYITKEPDHGNATEQLENENKSLESTRASIEKQLSSAQKTEKERVKQARQQGATLVAVALSQHASDDVRQGLRAGKRWYMTTPKLKKVRTAYQKAIADSTALVQAEIGKVSAIESSLLVLNTDGVKASQATKSTLVKLEDGKDRDYKAKKSRRTNFLIIADVLSVLFGLLAVWVRATFRAAVGVHSINEEKSIEGILWAAIVRVWNLFLNWLEKLLGVDLDGNGAIGMASGQTSVGGVNNGQTGQQTGAVAQHRQIGFFGKNNQGATVDPQQPATPVTNSPQALQQTLIITGVNGDEVQQLQDAIVRMKNSIRADESNLRASLDPNQPNKGNPETIRARIEKKQQTLQQLQYQLQQALS